MLAIVEALKTWRHYCHGANHTIDIITDHQNLRYFTSTKTLNQRQARWAEALSQFDFVIRYRPGTAGGKPDALSRRPEYAKGEGEEHTAILKPAQFISAIRAQELFITKIHPAAHIPQRGSERSAGLDIHACTPEVVKAGERRLIPTGLAAMHPNNSYRRIAPRSGLAKKGIDIGAGVVDADYRGENKNLLINHFNEDFTIQPGDRIAKLILEQIIMANPTVKDNLPPTTRGRNGFGSTGDSTLFSTANIGLLKRIQFEEDFLNRVRTEAKEDAEYQQYIQTNPEDKERQILDGLIYFKNRLQVPNHEGIRLEIAQSAHDSQVAGRFGQKKALDLISRNFHWPNLDDWVNQYVRSCDTCQRNKSPRHAKYGLLQHLDSAPSPWVSTW